jgi:hypothetical protein
MSAFLLKLFYYYAWLHLSTLAHELAHAVVGRLVGFAPKKIQVGTGPGSFKFTVLGLECDFRLMPMGGFCSPSRTPLQGLSWRGALMVAAGPACDLCMLWLLVTVWPLLARDDLHGSQSVYKAIELLIMYQLVMFLYSVVPHNVKIEGLSVPNDGKQFIQFVTGKHTHEARVTNERYTQEVRRYTPDFEMENSWAVYASAEELALLVETEEDFAKRRHEDGIRKLERLLTGSKIVGGERALNLVMLATTSVIRGHEVPLEKTLGWLREAESIAPEAATIRVLHGGALVQAGHYPEAVEILTPLTTPENEARLRAAASLFIAKAWNKQGDSARTTQYLPKESDLKEFDDLCELHKRITAELSPDADVRA